jgi:peptide/nickel transport system substrate-binding protein
MATPSPRLVRRFVDGGVISLPLLVSGCLLLRYNSLADKRSPRQGLQITATWLSSGGVAISIKEQTMLSRKKVFLIPALLLTLLLAACGGQSSTPNSANTPKRGGTLVVADTSDPGTLNPAITTAFNTHFVTDQIYNGLVGLDEHLNPVPDLAEKWTISADGKDYTFKLRSGVQWQDGQPFTSADVKFTFEQGLLKYHSRTKAGLTPVLNGIDAPDPLTVVFHFKQPYGPLLQRLDVVEASIIPQHIFEGKDLLKDPADFMPVGTGPFKFVEYVKGDHLTLARNPHYFKANLPYLDKIVFHIVPDTTTATTALEQGEVDYLSGVNGSDIARLQKESKITLVLGFGGSGGALCQDTLIPNLTKAPFNNADVRHAFYQALDRKFLLDHVYFNQGSVSTGPISQQMTWAYSKDTTSYAYDVNTANQLLDKANLPRGADGNRLTVTFTFASSFAKLAQAMQEQLKQVGINLVLESLDFNAAVQKVFVAKNFDLGIASYCNGYDPEIGVRRVYASTNIGPIPFSIGAGFVKPQIDQLFDQASALTDRTKRAQVYATIQKTLSDDLPYFWLVDTQGYRANRAVFKGFAPQNNLFEQAWTTGG